MGQRDLNERDEASLAERLREQIRRAGPITFRDWMAAALYDEREGYYCRSDKKRWGRAGDYRTGPEMSPMFAATFARFFAALYAALGAPPAWTIIEAGAGAGHFARGVLQTLQRWYPHIFAATLYVIDEASSDGRERARRELAPFIERVEFRPLDAAAPQSVEGIIFANELLDAFPVHRVQLRDGRLLELYVGLNAANDFHWVPDEPSTPSLAAYFESIGVSLREGQVAEVNLEAEEWIARAASVLKRGHLVLVDYGAEATALYHAKHRQQGTLRAFQLHRLVADTLARPGEQDLTTTVDWTHIIKACAGAGLQHTSFEPQDAFLLRAGLLSQLERMTAEINSASAEALALRASVRELILPGGMSESFQVLVQEKGIKG
jgi:SAM-dependent MidA family methyltransferase